MTALHLLTDEQLGNEIGLLISDRVDSAGSPAGVYLAIQDRLGEQDINWSVSRLIGRLLPSEWGLPMFTGMVMKVTAAIVVAIAIVAVLVFQGRDSEQGEIVPAADPTATATATAIPQIEPTATSEPVTMLDLEALKSPENISALPQRQLPAGLDPEQVVSQPSEETVLALWTEFHTNVILERARGNYRHFCGDGSSFTAQGANPRQYHEGLENSWYIDRTAGNSSTLWWEATRFMSTDLAAAAGQSFETAGALTVVDGTAQINGLELVAYESEYCIASGHGGSGSMTIAPVPTATPEPLPTHIADPVRNPPSLEALTVRALPSGLDPDQVSEQPSEDMVIELWTEHLKDSILPVSNFFPNIGDLHFCSDGAVVSTTGMNDVGLWLDTPEVWSVNRTAAMSAATWWEVVLNVKFDPDFGRPESSLPLLTLKIEDGQSVSTYLTVFEALPVYESEHCVGSGT